MTSVEIRAHLFSSLGELDDVGPYGVFLDRMRRMPEIQRGKAEMLEQLRIAPGMTALDVGCGLGDDVGSLADRVGAHGTAMGVDASTSLLRKARQRFAAANTIWLEGDAAHLPLGGGSVDRCMSDRMLQHVADGQAVVAEMFRVLRPGGRVVIADLDHGLQAFDTPHVLVHQRIANGDVAQFQNPYAGRKLSGWLHAAGFVDIRVWGRALVFDEVDLGSAIASARRAERRGAITGTEYAEYVDALQKTVETGRCFFAGVMFYAEATRP